MSKSMFTSSDKEFYADTEFYAINITINIPCGESYIEIPVKVIINKENGFINLSRIFEDLQKGLKIKQTDFKEFQYLKTTYLYVDIFSLMNHGHVHYSYNSQNIYGVSDNELLMIDPKNIPLRSMIKSKDSRKVKSTVPQDYPGEIYGEYNYKKGLFHGQYGDYRLVPKMMSHISPVYEQISDEFVRYLYSVLSTNETKNKQPTNEIVQSDTIQPNNDFMTTFQEFIRIQTESQKQQMQVMNAFVNMFNNKQ